jgi:hypothetical protein
VLVGVDERGRQASLNIATRANVPDQARFIAPAVTFVRRAAAPAKVTTRRRELSLSKDGARAVSHRKITPYDSARRMLCRTARRTITMNNKDLVSIVSDALSNVTGGFDAAKCAADTTAGFAAGAATTGGNWVKRGIGGTIWGAEAAATSSNCGDGTRSPAAMAGDFVSRNLTSGNGGTESLDAAYQSQY